MGVPTNPRRRVGTHFTTFSGVPGVDGKDGDDAKSVVRRRPETKKNDRKRPTRVLTRNPLFSGRSSTTARQFAELPLLTSLRRRRRRRRTLYADRTSKDIGPRTGPLRWRQTTIRGARDDPGRTIEIGANGPRRRGGGGCGCVTATTSAARPDVVLAPSYSNENGLNMAADDRTSDGVYGNTVSEQRGGCGVGVGTSCCDVPRRRRRTVGRGECGGTNRDNRVWRAGWC